MPELLLGIALLAFALTAAYTLMSTGVADVSHTRDFSTAVLLAQEAIEACRGWKFEKLDETDPALDEEENPTDQPNGASSLEYDFNHDDGPGDRHPHQLKVAGTDYTRTVTIDQVERNVPAGVPATVKVPPLKLKSVKVEIAWKTQEGRAVKYEAATLVSAIYR